MKNNWGLILMKFQGRATLDIDIFIHRNSDDEDGRKDKEVVCNYTTLINLRISFLMSHVVFDKTAFRKLEGKSCF